MGTKDWKRQAYKGQKRNQSIYVCRYMHVHSAGKLRKPPVMWKPGHRLSIRVHISYLLYTIFRSLHSKKLHILGFRARMVWTRSREIFFLSLSDRGTYHFCRRSFPCRLNRSMNCICKREDNTEVTHLRQDMTIHSLVFRNEKWECCKWYKWFTTKPRDNKQ